MFSTLDKSFHDKAFLESDIFKDFVNMLEGKMDWLPSAQEQLEAEEEARKGKKEEKESRCV